MFRTKYEGVYVPSTRHSNCGRFGDLSPNAKAAILEDQSGCFICNSFTHNTDRCHQRRQRKFVGTSEKTTGNKKCGRKHHPTLHPSRNDRLPGRAQKPCRDRTKSSKERKHRLRTPPCRMSPQRGLDLLGTLTDSRG